MWKRIKAWYDSKPPEDLVLNLLNLLFWSIVFGTAGAIIIIWG